MARAVAVVQVLSSCPELAGVAILPYSAGQAINSLDFFQKVSREMTLPVGELKLGCAAMLVIRFYSAGYRLVLWPLRKCRDKL